MQTQRHSHEVLDALAKLEHEQSTATLTLEEIMMCYFRLPCTRQCETSRLRFKRGSILVYQDQVIIIANPDDTRLDPHPAHIRRTKFITPQRRYGVYPGSHIYTDYTSIHVLEDTCRVRALRKLAQVEQVRPLRLGINEAGLFGSFHASRCPQETGLWGRLDAARFMQARGLVAEGAD